MEQSIQFEEKREYKRAIFAPEENASGVFSWLGSDDTVHVRVLNLSRGGVGFGFLRDEIKTLNVGQKLRLISIKIGNGHRLEVPELTLEVKWIIDHKSLNHLGIGCKFLNISKEQQDTICAYVNALLPNRLT